MEGVSVPSVYLAMAAKRGSESWRNSWPDVWKVVVE